MGKTLAARIEDLKERVPDCIDPEYCARCGTCKVWSTEMIGCTAKANDARQAASPELKAEDVEEGESNVR